MKRFNGYTNRIKECVPSLSQIRKRCFRIVTYRWPSILCQHIQSRAFIHLCFQKLFQGVLSLDETESGWRSNKMIQLRVTVEPNLFSLHGIDDSTLLLMMDGTSKAHPSTILEVRRNFTPPVNPIRKLNVSTAALYLDYFYHYGAG